MKLSKYILSLVFLALLPLSACGGTSCVVLDDPNNLLPTTPITDSLLFAQESEYASKKFTVDHVGRVTLKSCTDGDTANFAQEGYSETIKCRFLGINTPESTGKVEPWGKKASIFTKHALESATEIVLVNDVVIFGERDSSGNRWLGFIWYKTAVNQTFRLLNLEIVEQGFSTNQLFTDSSICNYRSSFEQAEAYGKACGYRVFGTPDPDFDYSHTVTELSIRYIIENFDEVGISDSSGSSGLFLRVTGLIIGQMGDNFVLRDVADQYENGKYASLYAYAGYNSALGGYLKLGDIVKVYCRATKYNGNIQLSDVQNKTTGKYALVVITPEDASYSDYPHDIAPYDMDSSAFTDYSDFAAYQSFHIKTTITIRTVTIDEDPDEGTIGEESYYKKDDSKNMTIYAWSQASGLTLNLRVDGTCNPYPSETLFEVGKSYLVVGYLAAYFEKYQLMLYNNDPEMGYITLLGD